MARGPTARAAELAEAAGSVAYRGGGGGRWCGLPWRRGLCRRDLPRKRGPAALAAEPAEAAGGAACRGGEGRRPAARDGGTWGRRRASVRERGRRAIEWTG